MAHFAMGIDLDRCSGCHACTVACQSYNKLRPGITWTIVDTIEWGVWPNSSRAYLPHGCLHCIEPLCVQVCPTGATYRNNDNGLTVINQDKCIGCGVCVQACVYGARTLSSENVWAFNSSEPAPYEDESSKMIGTAQKCSFCSERIMGGELPFCVAHCPTHARVFGDLENPQSDISQAMKAKQFEPINGTSFFVNTGKRNINPEEIIITKSQERVSKSQPTTLSQDQHRRLSAITISSVSAVAIGGVGISVSVFKSRKARREKTNAIRGKQQDV